MDAAACVTINVYLVQISAGCRQLLSEAVLIFQYDLKVIRTAGLDGVQFSNQSTHTIIAITYLLTYLLNGAEPFLRS